MYRQRLPHRYAARHPAIVQGQQSSLLSPKEMLWRMSWPYAATIVLATLMLVFTTVIFILEIASLATDSSNNLSNTASTGAGIWCSIFFVIPVILMHLLVLVYECSRRFATVTLIATLIALVFICVLIGLDANAVAAYNTTITDAPNKIKILKGQLAVGILMFIFPLTFVALYIYTAFKALYPFRPHVRSVYPPLPFPTAYVKH